MPAGNYGSCIHYIGLDICFDEYNYHDSLQVHLIDSEVCLQGIMVVVVVILDWIFVLMGIPTMILCRHVS